VEQIRHVCWALLETKGLLGLNAHDVAAESGLPLSAVLDLCPKNSCFIRLLWFGVEKSMDPLPFGLSPHDTLFEATMCVLDALKNREQAISRLLDDLTISPCASKSLDESLAPWVKKVFKHAGLENKGPIFFLKSLAYKGFLAACLKTWCKDDSPDKSVTLSYVDTTLSALETYYSTAKDFLQNTFGT
jgi:hypothetical protein